MKVPLLFSLCFVTAVSFAFANEITLDSARPVMIKCVPE